MKIVNLCADSEPYFVRQFRIQGSKPKKNIYIYIYVRVFVPVIEFIFKMFIKLFFF
jgi:hypothetical protein